MNCNKIDEILDDICQEQLSEHEHSIVNRHVSQCEHCQKKIEAHKQYLALMQSFVSPKLDLGQSAILLRQARNAKPQAKNDNGFFKGFIAASILFVGFFSSWQFTQHQNQDQIIVSAPQVKYVSTEVTLLINVPKDMIGADLTLSLPDDILVAGFESKKELNWLVDLKAGANSLSLPIKVPAHYDVNQTMRFLAKINYHNKEKGFELRVNLAKPQVKA